jgi:hypothetical protein
LRRHVILGNFHRIRGSCVDAELELDVRDDARALDARKLGGRL